MVICTNVAARRVPLQRICRCLIWQKAGSARCFYHLIRPLPFQQAQGSAPLCAGRMIPTCHWPEAFAMVTAHLAKAGWPDDGDALQLGLVLICQGSHSNDDFRFDPSSVWRATGQRVS